VSFLCLPAASYVTGRVICIDGGRTISAWWTTYGQLLNEEYKKCGAPYCFGPELIETGLFARSSIIIQLGQFICSKHGTDRNVPTTSLLLSVSCEVVL
jgi:hypothetical protein